MGGVEKDRWRDIKRGRRDREGEKERREREGGKEILLD